MTANASPIVSDKDEMLPEQMAHQVPLVEMLYSVPKSARAWIEETNPLPSTRHIPYGILCHNAANEITALRAAATDKDAHIKELESAATVAFNDRMKINSEMRALIERMWEENRKLSILHEINRGIDASNKALGRIAAGPIVEFQERALAPGKD